MSIWGNIYEGRTDTTGRIMRAVEKIANGMHDASRWTDEDDGPGNALQGLEREVIDILVDTRLPGYQELGVKCAELENKLDEVTSRAEMAEAELLIITPYATHTEFCAISTYDGPRKEVVCDCGYNLARDRTP